MSTTSSTAFSHISGTRQRRKQITLKRLVSVAVSPKLSFNMLKHTIALRMSTGLSSANNVALKSMIKKLAVPLYLDMLLKSKTYVPTVGREAIRKYVRAQERLTPEFRMKVWLLAFGILNDWVG